MRTAWAVVLGGISLGGWIGPAYSETFQVPKGTKIKTVEQILPAARAVVKREYRWRNMRNGVGLDPGERVLFATDPEVDPLVTEALRLAMEEAGGKVDMVYFSKRRSEANTTETMERTGNDTSSAPFPAWLYKAADEGGYDVLMGDTRPASLIGRKPGQKPRYVRTTWYTRDLLMLELYPEEILDLAERKVWQQIRGAKQIRVTDLEGTDLTLTLDDGAWRNLAETSGDPPGNLEDPIFPGHLILNATGSAKPDARGVVVGSTTHWWPMPSERWMVDGGKLVRVEGGGAHGEVVKKLMMKHKDEGDIWIAYAMELGTHPKYRRPYTMEEYRAMGRWSGWQEGRKRAGAVHLAASGRKRAGGTFAVLNLELFYTTVYADGRKIIDKGHLLALDDPEVRRVAAKYGNPDELLKVDWVPDWPEIHR